LNGKSKVIKASEIVGLFPDTSGNITQLINEKFYIVDAQFTKRVLRGQEIECAVVEIEWPDGKREKYFTWSKVLVSQLKAMKEHLDAGYKIEATLRKVKNYYTFE